MAKPFLFGKINAGRLVRELGSVSHKLPADLRKVSAATAADVGARARLRAQSLGGVHAHTAPGITVQGSKVGLDVNAQPAIKGAEFGGQGRPRTMQFPPWRGSGADAGYFLFPTIREEATLRNIELLLDDLID
jgi:hypothetical protein